MTTMMKRLLALSACALLLVTMIAGCGQKDDSQPAALLADCSVTVQTEGGLPLSNVGVTVYTDHTKTDLLDFARTDSNGVAKLNAQIPSGSAIILTDIPDGYAANDYYTISQAETTISLRAELKSELSSIELGGVMFDFTVTDQNGSEHTLSKLLETKKAVVLNLWYTTCVPCKMEFPYLQQAYNEYKDDIALLALNPVDNAAAVAAFAAENGLSFPMAACDPDWANQVSGIAYPTTIVVDRFGTVTLIHIGSIDNSATFKNLFKAVSADDYKQTTYADINQFTGDSEPLGTASNPYVHTGNNSFSVAVEPGQTIYYTMFGTNGLTMTVEGTSLKFVCNEEEYTPNSGKLSLTIHSDDAAAPVSAHFTNTGSSKATYKVSFTAPAGSATNPILLKDGSFTIKLEAGNNSGMHYQYKAAAEGTFTLECKNTANYTVSIKSEDGTDLGKLDKSHTKVSLDVHKNAKLQIVVTAVADNGNYPAVEAKLNASFKKESTPIVTNPTGNSSQLNTNGKLVNADAPIEYGGTAATSFNAEVKAGERVLFHLYRVSGMTMRIADASAYVIYEDKTYTSDKNGYVYVSVTSDSPNNPIVIQIGNGGTTNKTFAVKFTFPEGSMMNPYDAKIGSTKTNIAAGNEQGVYYQYTAEKDGKITITLKSVSNNTLCDIRVTVTDSSYIPQQYLLSETADRKTLTIDVYAGDQIEINLVTVPDENFKYPAATIETVLSFT